MATGIQDPNVKPKPSILKIVLNLIYSAMTAAKNMGMFSKGQGPKL